MSKLATLMSGPGGVSPSLLKKATPPGAITCSKVVEEDLHERPACHVLGRMLRPVHVHLDAIKHAV